MNDKKDLPGIIEEINYIEDLIQTVVWKIKKVQRDIESLNYNLKEASKEIKVENADKEAIQHLEVIRILLRNMGGVEESVAWVERRIADIKTGMGEQE